MPDNGAADFVPLPGGWNLWRGMVLRSAGFPITQVDVLADPGLAALADEALPAAAGRERGEPAARPLDEYDARFAASTAATSAAIRGIVRQPRFLEALTWQNPQFAARREHHLDAAERGTRVRKQEAAIGRYLQRYTTKNDTIGFFGPVGWAEWNPEARCSTVEPGPELLRRRTVYFEDWTIAELAAVLASRPDVAPYVAPRLLPANLLDENQVIRPHGVTQPVSEDWTRILRLCDGRRPVRDIAGALGCSQQWLLGELALMNEADLVRADLGGPIEAFPERRLSQRLAGIADPAARKDALEELRQLAEARQEVAAAAGQPPRLARALGLLADQFEAVTGKAAVRAPGQIYAARTLVFEDCVRDVEVTFGQRVLEPLGEPLALLLRSARWLATRVGDVYLDRLGQYYQRISQRTQTPWIPLGSLLAVATPDFYIIEGDPPLIKQEAAELQRRWAAILSLPDGGPRHPGGPRRLRFEPEQIAARVHEEFAAGPPQWALGLCHCPDLMIDATSPEAINRGEFEFVLGELHTAFNSVENQALAGQSDQLDRLRAMVDFASGPDRILLVASREQSYLTRTKPSPDVVTGRFMHWTMSADDVSDIASEVIPAAAMRVGRSGDALVVRCTAGQRQGRTFPLAEVLGELLSGAIVSSFSLLPPRPYTPRVSIGRLVVSRETWRLTPRSWYWALQHDERRRFLMMRQWVLKHRLPRRVFCTVPGERKPVYVDFTSVTLVNNLAAMLRKAESVKITEMLPGPEGCWLRDADGAPYTSELRMVVTERR